MLPETTTIAEILLYLSVLTDEAETETDRHVPATLAIDSDGGCLVTDDHNGERFLTISQLLIDMRLTLG